MNQQELMQRCLNLASNGLGQVSPNPLVGAVVIRDGKIIGEGWHQRFGGPHAEVHALNMAGDRAAGATLFVNLEPCSHTGKTPPCADLVIEKGITEVFIAMEDPNPLVSGSGIKKLLAAGIKVSTGMLQDEARELNRRFITNITGKRPYVILKWAQTANGMAGSAKERLYITSESSNELNHKWRSEEDAILVTTSTVLADNPELTCRQWPGRNPKRYVAGLRELSPHHKLFTGENPARRIHSREPREILKSLHQENIGSVIIEGGPTLHKSFLQENLWDEVRMISSTQIRGGNIPAPPLPVGILSTMASGNDIIYTIRKP